MAISQQAMTQIEEQIEVDRRVRSDAWRRLERADHPGPDQRVAWAEARERFWSDPGPIPSGEQARSVLRGLRGRYRGERAFVIGNGPSLNRTPLDLLRDEFTFGANRIYLLYDRIDWRPTFYTTLDWRFVPDNVDEVNALQGSTFFFPERFRGLLRDGDDVIWYWNEHARHRSEQRFATDASLGVRGAGSVVGASVQLAWYLGFNPIYLIGCDVSYSIPETVLQEGPDQFGNGVGLYLTSTEDDDPNHFDRRYFGTGRRWHDPNVKRMLEGFIQCRDGIEAAGGRLLNATVGGRLDVVERVSFRSLFPTPTASEQRPVTPSAASVAVAAGSSGDDRHLVLDVGSGTGRHAAVFAAAGWEVRAMEPDPDHRGSLRAGPLPPITSTFVDPRVLDPTDDALPLARVVDARSGSGVSPDRLIEELGDRVPAVLILDVDRFGVDPLRCWPFRSSRPSTVICSAPNDAEIIGIVRETLDAEGYVVATAPVADDLVVVDLVGTSHRPGLDGSDLEVVERIVATLGPMIGANPSVVLTESPTAGLRAAHLETELADLRNSSSWRVGHGIVRSVAKIRRAPRSVLRRVRSSGS